jgi:hypothetical protein
VILPSNLSVGISYPQGLLSRVRLNAGITNYSLTNEWSWGAMSGPVPDGSKSVVPFGAKSKNVASSVADPLEAWAWFTAQPVRLRKTTSKRWISLRSCRLNSKQLKTA